MYHINGSKAKSISSIKPEERSRFVLRKEVIQPQVLLRLPCYDLVLLAKHTLSTSLPYGFGR